MSLAIDPKDPTLSRPSLYKMGYELGCDWLDHNGLSYPKFTPVFGVPRDGNYGWYRYRGCRVTVNVKRCAMPSVGRSFAWSFPGWKADVTPIGVLAHELGHHVWQEWYVRDLLPEWKAAVKAGKPVSGYEPNFEEAFAESIKLFITNPNLLRLGRPSRWAFLTDELCLSPLDDTPWAEVLQYADQRYLAAGQNWMEKP